MGEHSCQVTKKALCLSGPSEHQINQVFVDLLPVNGDPVIVREQGKEYDATPCICSYLFSEFPDEFTHAIAKEPPQECAHGYSIIKGDESFVLFLFFLLLLPGGTRDQRLWICDILIRLGSLNIDSLLVLLLCRPGQLHFLKFYLVI